jgi:hypothetical protein
MIALRRHDVDDLNHRARVKMAATGRLTGPALDTGGLELQAGDRIVCLRNNRKLGVVNGTRATITQIHRRDRAVEAVDDRGVRLRLPADYLDAGHVTHGYAITGHKAQGLTCDHTYTLGTETLYREWGYVAMSRGRHTNRLYHGPTLDHDDGLHHHDHLDTDQPASLTGGLRRSRAEHPVSPETEELAAEWRHLEQQLDELDLSHLNTWWQHRDQLLEQRRFAADGAERARCELEQHRGRGRRARRAREELHNRLERILARLQTVDQQLMQADVQLTGAPTRRQVGELYRRQEELSTSLRRTAEQRIRSLRHRPPDYLNDLLGRPPTDPQLHERWERAATAVEHHRLCWNITDPNQALGNAPASTSQADQREQLLYQITEARQELRHGLPRRQVRAIHR